MLVTKHFFKKPEGQVKVKLGQQVGLPLEQKESHFITPDEEDEELEDEELEEDELEEDEPEEELEELEEIESLIHIPEAIITPLELRLKHLGTFPLEVLTHSLNGNPGGQENIELGQQDGMPLVHNGLHSPPDELEELDDELEVLAPLMQLPSSAW